MNGGAVGHGGREGGARQAAQGEHQGSEHPRKIRVFIVFPRAPGLLLPASLPSRSGLRTLLPRKERVDHAPLVVLRGAEILIEGMREDAVGHQRMIVIGSRPGVHHVR